MYKERNLAGQAERPRLEKVCRERADRQGPHGFPHGAEMRKMRSNGNAQLGEKKHDVVPGISPLREQHVHSPDTAQMHSELQTRFVLLDDRQEDKMQGNGIGLYGQCKKYGTTAGADQGALVPQGK
jgi:hypothetical protein